MLAYYLSSSKSSSSSSQSSSFFDFLGLRLLFFFSSALSFSSFNASSDKAGCQPATRGVQGKALFEGTQGEVQDGALDGNRGEEPAGEREIPAVH